MKKESRSLITALILSSFLMGCAVQSNGEGAFIMPEYSKERRNKMADELEACGRPYETIEFMKDYKQLRDQVRAK